MSDLLRMTGMFSGMDTESVISQLVQVRSQKVTNLKNDQKKLEWKQSIWQDLNKRIHKLWTGSLSNMRLEGTYAKKKTTVSDPTKAVITADGGAVNGTQSLEVNKLAKSGYLTGAALSTNGKFINRKTGDEKTDGAPKSMMSDIDPDLVGKEIKVTVGTGENAKTSTITITADMQIGGFVSKLQEAGLNASFDEKNQRFFISATGTGKDNDFTLTDNDNNSALTALGLNPDGSNCTRIYGQDAEIKLNGATFTSNTNTFSINGLSITAQAQTDGAVSITTDTDYDGVYNLVKDFIAEYNDIMNELTKLYGADSARKYNMLSDDEKDAMSEKEVEKWEQTIKDSLLRRDKDVYNVIQCFTGAVNKEYDVGGKKMSLVSFGIGTGNYFLTEKAERNALHIYGDEDDDQYASQKNKLKEALAENPEEFIGMFTQMSKDMYTSLRKTMEGTDYRSTYKVYDDKRMKTEYDDYTKRIKEAQKKLDAYEDKWYKKFSAMEVAMSKLQSNQNSLTGMLGQ